MAFAKGKNRMTHKILESSPKAKALIESYEDPKGTKPYSRGKKTYPWNQMKIGESFIVNYPEGLTAKSEVKFSLRNCANQKRVMNGKKFQVIAHDEYKVFEVARIE